MQRTSNSRKTTKFLVLAPNLSRRISGSPSLFHAKHSYLLRNKISFFGRIFTDKGVFPDPKKVEDIAKMPTPQDKQELQKFIGMATFLACHLPNFSEKSATLRDLLKKDISFKLQKNIDPAKEDALLKVERNIFING